MLHCKPSNVKPSNFDKYIREIFHLNFENENTLLGNSLDTQSQSYTIAIRTLDFAVLVIVFVVLLWRRLKFSLTYLIYQNFL